VIALHSPDAVIETGLLVCPAEKMSAKLACSASSGDRHKLTALIPSVSEVVMEPKLLIPAAQYVRMSTEDHQYSIDNQKATITAYAISHGFAVVSTYADAGKSGVETKHRHELRRLLSDVVRWRRFQDVDEAAHYEFLCRSAGIPVRYCAEQFENDGSAASAIMKAFKRTMAAEYSRELGVKVLAEQTQQDGVT